jgi:tryptophan synthase beta chain
MKSFFCQDENGQIAPVYSISAVWIYPVSDRSPPGCTIPGGPRCPVTDAEAVRHLIPCKDRGVQLRNRNAHAVAHVMKLAPRMDPDQIAIDNFQARRQGCGGDCEI